MKPRFFLGLIFALLIILLLKPVFSQSADNYFNKANSMLVSGNFEQAVSFYNNAIHENPKYADAYIGLGIAYKELGQYNEAEAATIQAIKLKPSYYQAYYNLGLIYEKTGKMAEARDSYERFLKEVPGAEKFSDAKQRISKLKKYLK